MCFINIYKSNEIAYLSDYGREYRVFGSSHGRDDFKSGSRCRRALIVLLQLRQMQPFASSLPALFERLAELNAKAVPPVLPNLPIRFFVSKKQALDRRQGFYFSFKICALQ